MSEVNVRHHPEASRFEAEVDGQLAVLQYMRRGDEIVFHHTYVPELIEGRGIATRMAKMALDYAQANNLKVIAQCSFVKAYIKRHKEYQPITANLAEFV